MDFEVVFQDYEGSLPETVGRSIERFLCVQTRRDDLLHPCLFWLHVSGGDWHRFFIDRIGVLHWHRYPTLDHDDVTNDAFPILDIGVLYALCGLSITEVSMRQATLYDALLTISLSDGRAVTLTSTTDSDLENEQTLLNVV
jgi:hypothetical protein